MILRALIVVACYVLSSVGIVISILFALEGLRHPQASSVIGLLIVYAWLAHVLMSVAWVRNRKIGRAWVVSGTFAGLVSVLWLPVGVIWVGTVKLPLLGPTAELLGRDLSAGVAVLAKTLWATLFPVVLVLPCLLLAIYLVRFHWKNESSSAQVSNG